MSLNSRISEDMDEVREDLAHESSGGGGGSGFASILEDFRKTRRAAKEIDIVRKEINRSWQRHLRFSLEPGRLAVYLLLVAVLNLGSIWILSLVDPKIFGPTIASFIYGVVRFDVVATSVAIWLLLMYLSKVLLVVPRVYLPLPVGGFVGFVLGLIVVVWFDVPMLMAGVLAKVVPVDYAPQFIVVVDYLGPLARWWPLVFSVGLGILGLYQRGSVLVRFMVVSIDSGDSLYAKWAKGPPESPLLGARWWKEWFDAARSVEW